MVALNIRLFLGCVTCLSVLGAASGSDWPQLQRDAARTGRSPEEVAPPYRARWLWFGNAGTLRNRESKPNDSHWTNDLTTGVGKSYPLPASVPLTLAGMMQPIVLPWPGAGGVTGGKSLCHTRGRWDHCLGSRFTRWQHRHRCGGRFCGCFLLGHRRRPRLLSLERTTGLDCPNGQGHLRSPVRGR